MNLVALYGRLIRDPELRYSENGKARAYAVVAVDRQMNKEKRKEAAQKGQQTSDFIPITAFGGTAEVLATHFKKGNKIVLEGRISTGNYEKDGKRIYTTDVIVDKLHFVDKKDR